MELREAQLLRILSSFFGEDKVMFGMSVLCICGGSLSHQLPKYLEINAYGNETQKISLEKVSFWAKEQKCLFTILDHNDDAKLVIDFEFKRGNTVDVKMLESQKIIPIILNASGIKYLTITEDEFIDITEYSANYNIVNLLNEKLT